jgi:hypothetical protein
VYLFPKAGFAASPALVAVLAAAAAAGFDLDSSAESESYFRPIE